MRLIIVQRRSADEKILKRTDEFVLSNCTNGEFINSIYYLSYHPEDRFVDDSIIVLNQENKQVLGVMMAAQIPGTTHTVVSHPGTTFAGPILNHKAGIEKNFEILQLILDYYESRYQTVEIRLRPTMYDTQPMEYIPFYLLNRGYQCGMTALVNVLRIDKKDSLDAQLESYATTRRRRIRKSIKEDKYVFTPEDGIREEYWLNLNHNLQSKFGASSTHTYEEIVSLKKMYPDRIQAFSARRKTGEYGAFTLVYRFKNVFHTQYTDLNYMYSSENPNLYLIHNLIWLAREEGYSLFSFGGSTKDRGTYLNQSLYDYKDGYGGGSILLPVFTKHV